jgi:hypothetical protein
MNTLKYFRILFRISKFGPALCRIALDQNPFVKFYLIGICKENPLGTIFNRLSFKS